MYVWSINSSELSGTERLSHVTDQPNFNANRSVKTYLRRRLIGTVDKANSAGLGNRSTSKRKKSIVLAQIDALYTRTTSRTYRHTGSQTDGRTDRHTQN